MIRTVEFHPVGYNVNLEQLFLPVNNIAVYAQVTVLDHEAVLFEVLILVVEIVAALEMAVLVVMEVGAPEIAVYEVVVLEVAALILALEVVVPDREVASFVVAVFDFDMVLRQGVAEMVAQEVSVLDREAILFELLIMEVIEAGVLEVVNLMR